MIESDFKYSDQKIHTTEDKIEYLDFDHMLQHAKFTLGLGKLLLHDSISHPKSDAPSQVTDHLGTNSLRACICLIMKVVAPQVAVVACTRARYRRYSVYTCDMYQLTLTSLDDGVIKCCWIRRSSTDLKQSIQMRLHDHAIGVSHETTASSTWP